MIFTKGNWDIHSTKDGNCTICHGVNRWKDGPQGTICRTVSKNKADAHLIAAAPEMYAALEQCIKVIPMANDSEEQDAARLAAYKALAKARGEA